MNGVAPESRSANFPVFLMAIMAMALASSCSQLQPSHAARLSKMVEVFGVPIIASSSVPDDKLLHAARVMAEYLDNDEDGTPDNAQVLEQMLRRHAFLVMFGSVSELESYAGPFPEGEGQDLQADETHPPDSPSGEFDGALEEVLHLITHVGYAGAYPAVFAEEPGSAVADAMDVARGGHFQTVPSSYPDTAWYTYDDRSCNYSCMVTEYTYWALTSLLGGQDNPGRREQIAHEWRLNTPQLLHEGDPAMDAILRNPARRLPTVLPDGTYTATTFRVSEYR